MGTKIRLCMFVLTIGLLFPLSKSQETNLPRPNVDGVCSQAWLRNGFISYQMEDSQANTPSSSELSARRNTVPSAALVAPDISTPRVNFECGKSVPRFRPVVGGADAQLASWPWMALLGNTKRNGTTVWFCGGVLINEQWILTAAHCPEERNISKVRLGEHDYADPNDGAPHQDFEVEITKWHPDYAFPQVYHDLALVKLKTKVKIQDFIRPVCLPWGDESKKMMAGQKVTVAGWGFKTVGGESSNVLQQVEVTVFPARVCDDKYRKIRGYSIKWPQGIGEESICAGDIKGGKDACQGDSGGPIVSPNSQNRYVLAGIVSLGYGCGSGNFPGLYVNSRYPAYLSWIKKTAF